MDLVDEQDSVLGNISEHPGQVAWLLDDRARGGLDRALPSSLPMT
jgi:hypothetical protein